MRSHRILPLILLIGLPGSGKSTLAEQWQAANRASRRIISTDAIRAQLFEGEAYQGPWLQIWRTVERQFQRSVTEMRAAMLSAVMYDATNAQRKQRKAAIALARRSGFTHIIGVWVDPSLDVCLQRNQVRTRQVPEAVILRMHRQLIAAPPAFAEGLDRLLHVCPIEPTGNEPLKTALISLVFKNALILQQI
jgi:predicted kinase